MPVPAVTPIGGAATYVVMELMDDPVLALFAAWRADIDSVPFAHGDLAEDILRGEACPGWLDLGG